MRREGFAETKMISMKRILQCPCIKIPINAGKYQKSFTQIIQSSWNHLTVTKIHIAKYELPEPHRRRNWSMRTEPRKILGQKEKSQKGIAKDGTLISWSAPPVARNPVGEWKSRVRTGLVSCQLIWTVPPLILWGSKGNEVRVCEKEEKWWILAPVSEGGKRSIYRGEARGDWWGG